MGMIQQSINQTLSLAGFMYSQTEHAKTQQEKRALHKEYQAQTKLIDAIEEDITVPNKDGKGRSYEHTPIEEMEEVLKAEKDRRATAEKLYKLEGGKDETLLDETGGGINYMEGLIKDRKQEEAKAQTAKETAEKEKQMSEQLAEASATIQARIKDPFAIADAEFQKAVQRKNEIERRKKGGMML